MGNVSESAAPPWRGASTRAHLQSLNEMTGHLTRSAAALGFIPSLVACADPVPTRVEHGSRIDFMHGASETVCGGTVAFLDGFVDKLVEFLGIEPPPAPIRYVYRPEGVDAACGGQDVWGCSYSEQHLVYAERADLVHELVHASVDWASAPHPFLREGLAVRLSDAIYSSRSWPDFDLQAAWNAEVTDESRLDAAYVVGYLLTNFGPDDTLAIYRALGPAATFEDFTRILTQVTGLAAAGLEQGIRSYDPTPWGRFPLTDPAPRRDDTGNAPGISVTPLPWTSQRTVSCDGDAIGPADYVRDKAYVVDTLGLEGGSYRVEFEGERGSAFLGHRELPIGISYSALRPPAATAQGHKAWVFADLPAGASVLIRTAPLATEEHSRVSIARHSEALAGHCRNEVSHVVSIPADVASLSLQRDGLASVALPFTLAADRLARVPSMTVEAVELCDAECRCQTVQGSQPIPLDANAIWWLQPVSDSLEAGLLLTDPLEESPSP